MIKSQVFNIRQFFRMSFNAYKVLGFQILYFVPF